MFIGLFTTPAYIRYFHNNEIMGVWFTILSVLAWILNCDMGIGNGLRNKLVGAMKSSDPEEGKKYVSSAYIFSFAVAAIIIAVVVILSGIVNWNTIFNINVEILDKEILTTAVIILIISICLQLILRLIRIIVPPPLIRRKNSNRVEYNVHFSSYVGTFSIFPFIFRQKEKSHRPSDQ